MQGIIGSGRTGCGKPSKWHANTHAFFKATWENAKYRKRWFLHPKMHQTPSAGDLSWRSVMSTRIKSSQGMPFDLAFIYTCHFDSFWVPATAGNPLWFGVGIHVPNWWFWHQNHQKWAESTIPASTNCFCWRSFLKSGIVYTHSMTLVKTTSFGQCFPRCWAVLREQNFSRKSHARYLINIRLSHAFLLRSRDPTPKTQLPQNRSTPIRTRSKCKMRGVRTPQSARASRNVYSLRLRFAFRRLQLHVELQSPECESHSYIV